MQSVKSFFLFCSGSEPLILKRTPTEQNKYAGIGATIFFTGLFAAIAGGFALFSIFKSYFIAIVFGLLWGLLIFNLDRYIVSTMKKKGHFFKDVFIALPRIALALIIAVVIAKPLELKIFQSEIDAELISMEQEVFKTQEDLLRERYSGDIATLEGEIQVLKTEIDSKATTRNMLLAEAMAEADGTGGSMKRNMGPIYRKKKEIADQAEADLNATIAKVSPSIEEKEASIASMRMDIEAGITGLERKPLDGFAAQLNALGRLSAKNTPIYWASIFIMLLFIAIETAPILTKLISGRSPYDFALNKHEYQFELNHKERTSLQKNLVSNKVQFDTETGQYKTRLAIKAEKAIAEQLIAEELEKVKGQPISWRQLLKQGNLFGAG